jgi:hypothetical protein
MRTGLRGWDGVEIDELIDYYPRLYHMAEDGSWPSIQAHGLLSTAGLIELFEVQEPQRTQLLTQHRPQSIPLQHAIHGHAVVRDQKPLAPTKLARLLDDMTVEQWIRLLNSHVFFWLHPDRVAGFLNAGAYRRRPHLVLTVDTRSLVNVCDDRVRLSHLNSGATAYMIGRRGITTLKPIADFQHPSSRQRPPRYIVELAVLGGVPDIAVHTVKVERWQANQVLETLHQRPTAHADQADPENPLTLDAHGLSPAEYVDTACGRAATTPVGLG